MTRNLQVATDLTIPAQAVTETFGILAVRGAGKSNTAAVLAEEMFKAKLPFVVVDPVRAWFGLRSSADGKSPGLPIPIFGGRRGDVPLERGAGNLMADLVVDQRLSCVLDLSDFDSEGSKKQFLLDFARRLYQRNEQPLHLFLEEADDYIPQRPMRDEAQLLRAWENIVRRGRNRGLGITLITQRSASINKNVLTQVQTLIAMRTTGPQDIAAIREWVKYHQQSEEILASLAELKDGEAWVWSPQLLGKTVRVRFRRRETFDSGATPKMGEGAKAPATLADIDLAVVKQRMAATIEKAKAEDPRELRKLLLEARAELARVRKAPQPVNKTLQPVEVPVLKDAQVKRLHEIVSHAERVVGKITDWRASLEATGESLRAAAAEISEAVRKAIPPGPIPGRPIRPEVHESSPAASGPFARALLRETRANAVAPRIEGDTIPKGERAVLTAIAQHGGEGLAREEISVLAGYAKSSRDTYLYRLREKGLVHQVGEQIVATDVGVAALGHDFAPLPTGEALQDHWLARLPAGEALILRALLEAYPKAVLRDHLTDRTGYAKSSRDTYLYRLRMKKLVMDEGRGAVKASPTLF